MKKKIAITTTSFGQHDQTPLKLLKERGFEIISNTFGCKLDRKRTMEICKDCTGIVAGTEMYDREILTKLGRVKVISRCGVGIESIDIAAAKKLGIKIFNTPDVPTLAVAELTVGLILNLLRKVNIADADVRKNKWKKPMGNLLHGKKIGIVGFGRIGQMVGKILYPFGTKLAYCDLERKECAYNCFRKGLKEILKWADIITVHISTPQSRSALIGDKELKLMREGSWLVNVSRGGVVNERVLHRALTSGHLRGAALDVFEQEPYRGPFIGLENVILTPHIGSYAQETRVAMEIQAVRNLLAGLGKANK